MASLLTSGEKSSFGQTYIDLFDTFARDVIVFKEPIRVINSVNDTPSFGYPTDQLPESVTYIPVSGIYKARIYYPQPTQDIVSLNSEIKNPNTSARMRVREEAKNYIENGRTEKITFDNKSWNVNYGFVVKRYIEQDFYEYVMKEIS